MNGGGGLGGDRECAARVECRHFRQVCLRAAGMYACNAKVGQKHSRHSWGLCKRSFSDRCWRRTPTQCTTSARRSSVAGIMTKVVNYRAALSRNPDGTQHPTVPTLDTSRGPILLRRDARVSCQFESLDCDSRLPFLGILINPTAIGILINPTAITTTVHESRTLAGPRTLGRWDVGVGRWDAGTLLYITTSGRPVFLSV